MNVVSAVNNVNQITRLLLWLQPFAPLATALEGTLLGALEITHVAIRTVVSATMSCGFLWWANMQHLGLFGVWGGLVLVVILNMLFDIWKMISTGSPLARMKAQSKRQ